MVSRDVQSRHYIIEWLLDNRARPDSIDGLVRIEYEWRVLVRIESKLPFLDQVFSIHVAIMDIGDIVTTRVADCDIEILRHLEIHTIPKIANAPVASCILLANALGIIARAIVADD